MRLSRRILFLIGSLTLTTVFCPVALAQDLEPNDSCSAAQDGGTIVPPAIITGSIDGPNPTPPSDLDFYRVRATPGLMLRLAGGAGARAGVFSEACMLLAAPLDIGENQLDFTVPGSGTFIIAVAERFDEFFDGGFGAPNSGPYAVSIALAPPPIGSISGRLVNAVTRTPVAGSVHLRRCTSGSCFELVNLQGADENAGGIGVFRFESDLRGRPILSGEFQLDVNADGFEPVTLRFSVAANQNLDFGNVALTPPPVVISNIRPCMALSPRGGTCQYSVNIRNNTPSRITGQAFSVVEVGPSRIGFDGTTFEASTQRSGTNPVRAPISIPGRGASRDVTFFVNVPSSFIPEGTMICTQLQVGVNPSPMFNVVSTRLLFCITRDSSGFRTMSVEESRAAFDLMKAMDAVRPSR